MKNVKKTFDKRFLKNKHGWIRVVEAFVAILLVLGAVLMLIDKRQTEEKDISSEIYEFEIALLKEIATNSSLRADVLNAGSLPVEYNSLSGEIKNKIENRTPYYLNCTAKICEIDDACVLNFSSGSDVYVQSTVISANLQVYSPRQLKLFCWTEVCSSNKDCIYQPDDICKNTSTLIKYNSGVCSHDLCEYSSSEVRCEFGCAYGKCAGAFCDRDPDCKNNQVCLGGYCNCSANYENCDENDANGCECNFGAGNVCYNRICCSPRCSGKQCGNNGCGGSCGTCGVHASCSSGSCVCDSGYKDCDNDGTCETYENEPCLILLSELNNGWLYDSNDIFVSGNYVYVTGKAVSAFNPPTSLLIIDTSDKINPFIKGKTTFGGFSVGGLNIGNNLAYYPCSNYMSCWSDSCRRINIINISNPMSPSQISYVPLQINKSAGYFNPHLVVKNNHAYALGYIHYSDGRDVSQIDILDVSDYGNPLLKGILTGSNFHTLGIFVEGNYAYVIDDKDKKLILIDVSNPNNPQIRNSINLDSTRDIKMFFVKGNYVYVVEDHYSGKNFVSIVDVSNPNNPLIKIKKEFDLGYVNDIYVKDNKLYVFSNSNKLTIIDVSNPSNPTIIGSRSELANSASIIFVQDDYIYILESAVYGNMQGNLKIYCLNPAVCGK